MPWLVESPNQFHQSKNVSKLIFFCHVYKLIQVVHCKEYNKFNLNQQFNQANYHTLPLNSNKCIRYIAKRKIIPSNPSILNELRSIAINNLVDTPNLPESKLQTKTGKKPKVTFTKYCEEFFKKTSEQK